MPPEPIALDSSDEDGRTYLLRLRRTVKREPFLEIEVDELESDAEDELLPVPQSLPKPSLSRPLSRGEDSEAEQRLQERRRKRREAKEEKRKRRRAEKRATTNPARQKGNSGLSRSADTASPSSAHPTFPSGTSQHANCAAPLRISEAGKESADDEAPLPSLVVRRASVSEPNQEPRLSPAPVSEDEVQFIASQPSLSQNGNAASTRASSVPVPVEPEEYNNHVSQRASSAQPQGANEAGGLANPIELSSSDAPLQPNFDRDLDDVSVSDVSSVSYDEDSEEYEKGAEFYTSSEGSTHASDSEDGLGSWTEYDKENWQGSTAHLDDAYDGNFDVRAVLRHRKNPRRGFMEYRTVWAGYPIYSSTWEPESHFNSKRTLREYWDRQGGRPADVHFDRNEYSTHDSDTDVAVNRRPRSRAHAAKKKKRREVRRDKVQLRQYLLSLSEERARAKAKEEERYEKYRRANRLTLDTERIREKGTSRSYQKRMEKIQKKRWRRSGGDGGQDIASSSRLNLANTNRIMADVSMKARAGVTSGINSARTRVSQLNDSIPENDDNQITFRRSGPNFPGLGSSSMAPIRERPGFGPGTARPTVPPSSTLGGPVAYNSGSNTQAPVPRPPPGSYKGAHRREPKVQVKEDFGSFLNRLHGGSGISTAGPRQVLIDPNVRPITATRRPSEARKPNLLVLKPVEDFKDASRPVPTAAAAATTTGSSASSDAGDIDAFGVPEMSAVRNRFNPHQPVPQSDDELKLAKTAQTSMPSSATVQRSGFVPRGPSPPNQQRSRVEDPRRRPSHLSAVDEGDSPASLWSPADAGHWSPQEPSFSAPDDTTHNDRAAVLTTSRSSHDSGSHSRGHERPKSRAPQRIIWFGWLELVVAHNMVDAEGALCAADSLSPDRLQALGLTNSGTAVRFDMFMPFPYIRDILAGHSVNPEEAMLLEAHGVSAPQIRFSLDQVSEQLKDLDVALLAYAGEAPASGDRPGRHEYFVAFSGKYGIDYISGVPPALRHICGQPFTLCIVPLQLDHLPAPSSQISLGPSFSLDPSINSIFEAAVGKKTIEDLKIGRNDIRKVKRAAQRYGIVPQLYEGIRSKYNVIFLGRHPPTYEKSVLYYMVRIFEGGARLKLDPEKDAKLLKDAKIGTNVFVRRAALNEILEGDQAQPTFALGPYLRRLKRQPRCKFWTFGFSSDDPDERIREIFPGHDGLVTFSVSAILEDLLRSTIVEEEKDDKEEGQLTQTEKTPPSILCKAAYHVAENWRVRLHPWIRPCFKLLSDHLEPVCRSLGLIEEGKDFPIELMLELDSKLEALYTSALVEEWPSHAIDGLPFEEPTEVPDDPAELVKRLDKEVLATLHKAQLASASDTRFHVLVAKGEELVEENLAGVEVMTPAQLGQNKCKELAKLPGN